MAKKKAPKVLETWEGITHGKSKFATLEEAQEFSAMMKAEWGDHDCGWYWTVGQIDKAGDGCYWVVRP
jgi:hypothetical protein